MGEAMDALQRAYKAWRSRQDDGQLELDVDNQDGGPGRESRPLSALQGGEMNDETTEESVTLDLVAVLEMYSGSFGGDGVVITDVYTHGQDAVRVTTDDGATYELEVRRV